MELLYSNENQISHMVHFKHHLESANINIFKESALVQLGQYLKQLLFVNMSVCQIEQVLMFLILIIIFYNSRLEIHVYGNNKQNIMCHDICYQL